MDTITDPDISVLDLSKEELQREYSTLKEVLKANQTTLDAKNQQIYDLQRELTRTTSLEQEYLQEIEILQSNERAELKKLESTISDLQEEIAGVRAQNREGVLELEQLILKKDEEIEGLKTQLAANASCLSGFNEVEYDKLLEENALLKEEFEILVKKLEEKEVGSDILVKQLERMSQERDENKEEYNNMEECYKIKKQELNEAKELIETLQEEIMVMRSELDSMKNKPSDTDARGNSLFAEVNDRRVQLQKNMGIMKTQYVEMKKEYSSLLNQIATLKRENTYLSKQWNEDIAQREQDDGRELVVLKNRVKTLEELHARYEELLKERAQLKSDLPEDEIRCIESMIKNKDSRLEEAWKNQNEQSMKVVTLSRQLHNSNQELREWKSKTFRLESELSQQRTEKQMTQEINPTECCKCKQEKQSKKENYNFFPNFNNQLPKAARKKPVDIDIKELLNNRNDGQTKTGKENDCNEGNLNEEQELEVMKNPLFDESIIPSILNTKNTKDTAIDLEDMENIGRTRIKKCVKFTEDTREINELNTVRPKKRGTVLTCPIVYVPSAPVKK